MHIGYARVSTQDLRLQYAALQAAGCDNIYDAKASGAPGPPETGAGDAAVVVWKLDRLSRSVKDRVSIVGELEHPSIRRSLGTIVRGRGRHA